VEIWNDSASGCLVDMELARLPRTLQLSLDLGPYSAPKSGTMQERFKYNVPGGEGGEGAEIGCLVPWSGKVLHSGSEPPQLAPCLRVVEQHRNK
jgi:hypothetical protein